MEIRVLRYFLAVVREEGINRAAEALHITQPTLSRQLSQLEEEVWRQTVSQRCEKNHIDKRGNLAAEAGRRNFVFG